MKLSIIELATVAPGGTEADALVTAVDAERLGFARVWFAEHHVTQAQASHNPEVLRSPPRPARTRSGSARGRC